MVEQVLLVRLPVRLRQIRRPRHEQVADFIGAGELSLLRELRLVGEDRRDRVTEMFANGGEEALVRDLDEALDGRAGKRVDVRLVVKPGAFERRFDVSVPDAGVLGRHVRVLQPAVSGEKSFFQHDLVARQQRAVLGAHGCGVIAGAAGFARFAVRRRRPEQVFHPELRVAGDDSARRPAGPAVFVVQP